MRKKATERHKYSRITLWLKYFISDYNRYIKIKSTNNEDGN